MKWKGPYITHFQLSYVVYRVKNKAVQGTSPPISPTSSNIMRVANHHPIWILFDNQFLRQRILVPETHDPEITQPGLDQYVINNDQVYE